MDARRAWLKFAGVMAGACIGGFGLGCLVAALVGKRLWDGVTSPL